MSDVVRVVAPAKLTLSLRITGVRQDGLHLVDAEMVSLSLHDVVTIDPDGDGVTTTGRYAAGVPSDDGNIVAKALWLVERRAGVAIDKRIPHGGGLGGGSSDAAAVLRWAGFADAQGAAVIGADVPFCLVGGRARVQGIGEIVEPLPHVDRELTLVVPPLSVSTQAVYRAWDEMGGPTASGPNDLEPAAIRVEPALARWRDLIGDASGESPILAGSGATWWLPGEREDAVGALRDEGAEIVAARAVPALGATDGSSAF
jgi:4-diphosphocytidyl-2-C-methyl-D-erythritol kinase